MSRLPLLALGLSILAGCSGTPASFGLTGRVAPTVPEAASDAVIGLPGIQPDNGSYTPRLTPSTGSGRYFGYDD